MRKTGLKRKVAALGAAVLVPAGVVASAAVSGDSVVTTAASSPSLGVEFLPWHKAYIADESKLVFLVGPRRSGKDYAEAFRAVAERVLLGRPISYNYVSRKEQTAREFLGYVKHFAELFGLVADVVWGRSVVDDGRGAEIKTGHAKFTVNGREVKITAHSSHPDAVRGFDGDVCLSEFAFYNKQDVTWAGAAPAAALGGRIRVNTTAGSKGSLAFRMLEMGRRLKGRDSTGLCGAKPGDMPFSVHEVTLDDAIEQGWVELINRTRGLSYTRESFRAECRQSCLDQRQFDAEFMAAWDDEAGAYLTYELMRPCVTERSAMPRETVTEFLADVASRCRAWSPEALYAGVDVGRVEDRFVVWCAAKVGGAFRTAGLLRWKGRNFTAMDHAGRALMSGAFFVEDGKEITVRRLCADSTGLGMQLAEQWQRDFRSRVEPVSFTSGVKAELAPLVRRHVEERTVELPDDPGTLAALNSVRQETTVAGNVRYQGEKNDHGHADEFWALALALHAGAKPSVFIDGWTAGGVRL